MQIEVFGTAGVIKKLRAKKAIVLRAFGYILERAGMMFEEAAKDRMSPPVDTGRYRASIGHYTPGYLEEDNPDSSSSDAFWKMMLKGDALELQVGTNVDYAEWIEYRFGIFAGAIDLIAPEVQEMAVTTIAAVMKL